MALTHKTTHTNMAKLADAKLDLITECELLHHLAYEIDSKPNKPPLKRAHDECVQRIVATMDTILRLERD